LKKKGGKKKKGKGHVHLSFCLPEKKKKNRGVFINLNCYPQGRGKHKAGERVDLGRKKGGGESRFFYPYEKRGGTLMAFCPWPWEGVPEGEKH